jgi:hypothetical protein
LIGDETPGPIVGPVSKGLIGFGITYIFLGPECLSDLTLFIIPLLVMKLFSQPLLKP